jgi:predicted PurR-regulated permease PerM
LLAWAFVAIYFIDDILEPIFVNQTMKIHPFLILISILGGIALMGPIGFIAGPVILSIFFALLNMYPLLVSDRYSS